MDVGIRSKTPRGTVAVLGGWGEFIEKYFEAAGELLSRDFAVAMMDWRGQGGSDRPLRNSRKGHVDDFSYFERDLAALVRSVLEPKRQLLMAQLAMLFEKPAAQDRLGRQTLSPGLLDAVSVRADLVGRDAPLVGAAHRLTQTTRLELSAACERAPS
jgi:Serine aminopeptidase, S33